jgi:hypothetical protein
MRITYEIITPESAEQNDVAEHGFVSPGYGINVPIDEAMNKEQWPAKSLEWSLSAAEMMLGRGGMEDCGRWFSSLDSITDMRTGAETRYSLHPDDNITPASYARLARIFCL